MFNMTAIPDSQEVDRKIGVMDLKLFPPRIVKTEGFERLFSHYTGLHGGELLEYLQDFQTKALKVLLQGLC